jgi:hypothetical protein
LYIKGYSKSILLQSAQYHPTSTVGNVHNNGGYLEVYGTINGYLITESGNTQIDPDANIKQIL